MCPTGRKFRNICSKIHMPRIAKCLQNSHSVGRTFRTNRENMVLEFFLQFVSFCHVFSCIEFHSRFNAKSARCKFHRAAQTDVFAFWVVSPHFQKICMTDCWKIGNFAFRYRITAVPVRAKFSKHIPEQNTSPSCDSM